ncbi:TetR/AcrR family transcriptional regulator [Dyadobacter flavalbus]|uniref:TetR/AcrR family transcriptional regulator n=1 Tax=Dyadobacter flavalbus TaxID=2579942 RepID=A0A5M8QWC2_9BACT|nr:TetR/AcrR family transcriptional regulator [Dyadobacter flavalbus]KAA6439350.1 TetR/AcrR family transcriptional regulator [Dyadobacter flavalbus]
MGKAADTRLIILQKAFELIYRNGYQATSIDVIIATTQVTKGAFYYHFKSKEEMGLAIIKEVMYPGMAAAMIDPLLDGKDVPDKIYRMMEGLLLDNPFFDVQYGCPAVNLIEEMSPLNLSFRNALTQLVVRWQHAIEHVLTLAQQSGKIRAELAPRQIALFVVTGYSGVRNMGKVFGRSCYHDFLAELKTYLQKLA